MESVADILKRIQAQASTMTPEKRSALALEDRDDSPPCERCKGFKYISLGAPVGHPDFGRAVACPDCTPGPETFFKDIEVTDENRLAVEYAVAMAIKPEGWLIIKGRVGVGKTTLLKAIQSCWAGRESIPMESAALLDFWRSRFDAGDFHEHFDSACKAARFGLDELGAEKHDIPWPVERLSLLLNHRYINKLPTVITTNLDEVLMARALGPRIADRVFDRGTGWSKVVEITGESYRTGRTW